MKVFTKAIAIYCLLFTGSVSAFYVNPAITVTSNVVTATVVNNFRAPIMCTGQARGLAYSGYSFYSYVNEVVIFPGQWINIHVYSYFDPFVNGAAFINCHFY